MVFSYFDLMYSTVGVNLYKLQANHWAKLGSPRYSAQMERLAVVFSRRKIWSVTSMLRIDAGCFTCLGLYAKRPFRGIYSIQIKVTSKGAMVLPLVGCLNSASQSLSKPSGNRNIMENMEKLWETDKIDKRSWTWYDAQSLKLCCYIALIHPNAAGSTFWF